MLELYKLTGGFPKQEQYALTIQMRRAAVSIPANIAQGFRRRTRPEKARFLNIAQGSLEECRYYLILSQDLGYASTDALSNRIEKLSRMLTAYTNALLTPEF